MSTLPIAVTVRNASGMTTTANAVMNITDTPPPPTTWPGPTNTGYKNAPGYPGSLTKHTGALVAGTEYRFKDISCPVDVRGSKFFGCRFSGNWVDGWNVRMFATSEFRFCTIEPSAPAALPNPAWPSAGAGKNVYGGAVAAYMLVHNQAYQYGIIQEPAAGLLIEDSDIWGFGNSITLFGAQQKTIRRCWIHDAAHEGPGAAYHQDGPGHLNDAGCSNVLIEDCTIASLGNTNGIAFQRGTYDKIIVRRNFLSGFGYLVDMCHATPANTNLTFEDNLIATDIGWFWGPIYTDFSANFRKVGSSWKRNKLRVLAGTVPRGDTNGKFTQANDGMFVHPNSTYSATDWAP